MLYSRPLCNQANFANVLNSRSVQNTRWISLMDRIIPNDVVLVAADFPRQLEFLSQADMDRTTFNNSRLCSRSRSPPRTPPTLQYRTPLHAPPTPPEVLTRVGLGPSRIPSTPPVLVGLAAGTCSRESVATEHAVGVDTEHAIVESHPSIERPAPINITCDVLRAFLDQCERDALNRSCDP